LPDGNQGFLKIFKKNLNQKLDLGKDNVKMGQMAKMGSHDQNWFT
jgi:hypothetical protein